MLDEIKEVPLPGSDGEHALQEKYNRRPNAAAFYQHQMLDHLNPAMQAFVARRDMMFVATADRNGEADATFRAGPSGFVRVLDEKTLAYPEYRGNGVMASLGNISENPHVGLLFVDFAEAQIGLHVNGRARIVENDDFARHYAAPAAVRADLAVPGRQRPERWVVIRVMEAYVHCSKHIPHMLKVEDFFCGTDAARPASGDYFGAKSSARHTTG